MVSVRVTPSSERIRLISCSSVDVFARLHLEQQRVLAGHVVALEHVVERDDLALERADQRRGGS